MKRILAVLSVGMMMLAFGEEPVLTVRLIRHGQPGVAGTDFTRADKAAWAVLGLTPLGRKQAELTGAFLKKEGVRWRRIISSPQERAAETAEIISALLGMTYTLAPDLREIGNPVRETLPALRKRFKHIDPEEKLELSGEGRKGFKEDNARCGARGRKFISDLMKQGEKGPVLLVAHGNFIFCTVLAMTGKRVLPWNCGMTELKVRADGSAELVKAAYPEILPAEFITCNQNFFHKDPWFVKFMPHPAPRPDAVALVNGEFREFAAGRRSSWKPERGTPARLVGTGGGKISLTGEKKKSAVVSPRFPLERAKRYVCRMEFHGRGTGACRVSGLSGARREFRLAPETKSCELVFDPGNSAKFVQLCFEALPGSRLVLTNFRLYSEDPIDKTSNKSMERRKEP